ncbi:MAG TPA: AAA family ATPase [Ktedonobacteraceae bacterium]|nr:AAA family ATPase [Ktedonobacteraceae bacterium]
MPTQRREIAAQAVKELWRELQIAPDDPLIFASPVQRRVQLEHHPLLLNRVAANAKQRKKASAGQLKSWELLDAPVFAQGIAATGEVTTLLKSDMYRAADIGERGSIPSSPYSWICYTFVAGWKALSVYYYDSDTNDAHTLNAVPPGHQDDWLAFLKLLDETHEDIWRQQRRGTIEIVGGEDELADAIMKSSYDDVVLPLSTLALITAQRRIFDKDVLSRYAALHIPRLRKVLLMGPPGTGKTSLLKAEGAYHAKQGGLVFYVCTPTRNNNPWQQLSYVLRLAGESNLPTLILVEDFEVFVANPQDLQLVLNTLDGVATPDNPAGTLLLATSNDPEKIDHRIRDRTGRIDVLIEIGLVEDVEIARRMLAHFLGDAYREEEHAPAAPHLLKHPGSHFREVCLTGIMHALEQGRAEVSSADLHWANEIILTGQAVAEETERYTPSTTRKRGSYFGRNV